MQSFLAGYPPPLPPMGICVVTWLRSPSFILTRLNIYSHGFKNWNTRKRLFPTNVNSLQKVCLLRRFCNSKYYIEAMWVQYVVSLMSLINQWCLQTVMPLHNVLEAQALFVLSNKIAVLSS